MRQLSQVAGSLLDGAVEVPRLCWPWSSLSVPPLLCAHSVTWLCSGLCPRSYRHPEVGHQHLCIVPWQWVLTSSPWVLEHARHFLPVLPWRLCLVLTSLLASWSAAHSSLLGPGPCP